MSANEDGVDPRVVVADLTFELLPATAADDSRLIRWLTELVNEVYAAGEDGLWISGANRTNVGEMAGFARSGELAIARLGGDVVGCVRVQRMDETTGEFGLLAADPTRRGIGIGRQLVRFAEEHSRAEGRSVMRLELLVPRTWTHPVKAFLAEWYERLGYRLVRRGIFHEEYPHLAPLLATPCDFLVYHKQLAGGQRTG